MVREAQHQDILFGGQSVSTTPPTLGRYRRRSWASAAIRRCFSVSLGLSGGTAAIMVSRMPEIIGFFGASSLCSQWAAAR
jgi:hypothetical protein